MKFTYPAIIRKEEDGNYHAVVPDLKDCEAKADSLDEVLEAANQAVREWIELELSEDVVDLPPVSHPEDFCLAEGEFTRNICVNIRMFDGWDE